MCIRDRAKTVSIREIRHEKLILRSQSAGTRQLFEKHLGARNLSLSEFNVMMELDKDVYKRQLRTGMTCFTRSLRS